MMLYFIITFALVVCASLFLAVRSMKDHAIPSIFIPNKIELIKNKLRLFGVIVFDRGGVKHYIGRLLGN